MSLPSELQVLQLFQGTGQQQFTMKRLIQHFAVAVEERPAFRETIRAMVARGKLVLLHGTRYAMQGVMYGDRVLVRLETRQRSGERRSGRVVQVLERGQQEVVGRVEMH